MMKNFRLSIIWSNWSISFYFMFSCNLGWLKIRLKLWKKNFFSTLDCESLQRYCLKPISVDNDLIFLFCFFGHISALSKPSVVERFKTFYVAHGDSVFDDNGINEKKRWKEEKQDEINLDKKASMWCQEVIIDFSNRIDMEEVEKTRKFINLLF